MFDRTVVAMGMVLAYLWLLVLLTALSGCSTATICCPNHQGMIQSKTFDFLGTTTISCGSNTGSIGNSNALGSAGLSILALAIKAAPFAASENRTPQPTTGAYICQ